MTIFSARMTQCFVATLLGAYSVGCHAQESATKQPTQRLIVDMRAIPENSRAKVVEALVAMHGLDNWQQVTVDSTNNKTLEHIVNNQFRFYRKDFPETTDKLLELIRKRNSIREDEAITPGQTVLVPSLPKRPLETGGKSDLLQLHDFSSGRTTLISGAHQAPKADSREGNGWLFEVTPEERTRFVTTLGEETAKAVLGKYVDFTVGRQVIDVIAPPMNVRDVRDRGSPPLPRIPVFGVIGQRNPGVVGQASAAAEAIVSETAVASLTTLAPDGKLAQVTPLPAYTWDRAKAGKYYVLDYFRPRSSDYCPHGQVVLDRIRSTLERFDAGHLFDHIVPIEVDFYGDKEAAAARMRQILRERQPGPVLMANRESTIVQLLKEIPADPTSVPGAYLETLLSWLVWNGDTVVVSSSFWTRWDGFDFFPSDYFRDSKVVLLTAVLDEPGEVEKVTTYEPIRTYRDHRHEYGVALIGGDKNPGVLFGMHSEAGDAVHTVEDVVVQGITGACNGKEFEGTSFSTPIVGTYLFLAVRKWKDGDRVTAKEARRRLLLSSDINHSYVKKIASAGKPNVQKLLRDSGAWAETSSGQTQRVDGAINVSYVEYEASEIAGVVERKYFSRAFGGFSGLKIVKDAVYMFSEARQVWEKIEIRGLVFKPEGASGLTLTLNDFIKQYREVVIQ